MSFLDDAGVTKLTSYLKSKIQTLLSKKQDTLISGTNIKSINGNSMLGSGNIAIKGSSWYGTSSTAATTATKSVTCGGYVLQTGGGTLVCVTFSTANTYVSGALKLNVNSTGAKNIYVNNAVTSASNTLTWDAGECLTFVYSGSYYYFVGRSKTPSGESVTVDSALSSTSENPVQNKVINTALGNKQDTLVSGTNIKTINNQSLLGSGNISISGGGGSSGWTDIKSDFISADSYWDHSASAFYAITNGQFVVISFESVDAEHYYKLPSAYPTLINCLGIPVSSTEGEYYQLDTITQELIVQGGMPCTIIYPTGTLS